MTIGTIKEKCIKKRFRPDGIHAELPFVRFEYQPSRVLQYKELNTQMYPYDDNQGKYPPTYFLKN